MKLDTDFVRAQFPAFAEPALQGQAFFENAGGSYTCRQVIDRLSRFYTQRKVQPYGPYAASRLGGEEMDEARARLAAMLGVAHDELSFGPSTSQNTYVLAQAFRQSMRPGDAVIVSDQDHEANSGPWRRLADAGFEVREWRVEPETGSLDPARLADLLDDKVRLVCFPHCSNVIGEINDVAAICRIVHEAGAVACVDGVSYAPHGLPDVERLGADIYLFSAYKTYGPHQGLMVIRRALGEALPNQGHHFNGEMLYKRFTPAGPDHAQVAACAGMADYFDALHDHHFGGREADAGANVDPIAVAKTGTKSDDPAARTAQIHDLMRAHETEILQPLLDYAAARNSVRLLGARDAGLRAPTVALGLEGTAIQAAEALARQGIMAGGGDFYAQRPLRAVGIDPDRGVLRLSFVHYTTEAEVAKLIEALDRIL